MYKIEIEIAFVNFIIDKLQWYIGFGLWFQSLIPLFIDKRFNKVIDKRFNYDELCSELNCYFKSVGGQLKQVVSTSDTCYACNSSPLEHVSIGEIKLMLSRLTQASPVSAITSLGSRWKAEKIYVFRSTILPILC